MPTQDGTAQDHTGKEYLVRARDDKEKLAHSSIMKKPELLFCEYCNTTEFRIICDNSSHAAGGIITFRCINSPRCPAVWPEMQMHIPKMTKEIEKMQPRSGRLWTPAIDVDEVIEVPRG